MYRLCTLNITCCTVFTNCKAVKYLEKNIYENSIGNKIILKSLKVPWFRTVEGLDLHDETKYGLFH